MLHQDDPPPLLPKMPKQTGLLRRKGRYSLRRKVPADLREALGKNEIRKALGTSDPNRAARLLPVEWLKLDQLFAEKRRDLQRLQNQQPTPTPIASLDQRFLKRPQQTET